MDVILVAQLIVDLLLDLDLDFGDVTEAELVDEIADILEDNT
jgi:hypothetical protein